MFKSFKAKIQFQSHLYKSEVAYAHFFALDAGSPSFSRVLISSLHPLPDWPDATSLVLVQFWFWFPLSRFDVIISRYWRQNKPVPIRSEEYNCHKRPHPSGCRKKRPRDVSSCSLETFCPAFFCLPRATNLCDKQFLCNRCFWFSPRPLLVFTVAINFILWFI